MDSTMPRSNPSTVIAAIIVAAGLVAAALIVAHRPAPAVVNAPSSKSAAAPLVSHIPPISQASAGEQFRAQVLAAPSMHTYVYEGVRHVLTGVRVTSVSYDAKEDKVSIFSGWVWQPAMPKGGPDGAGADFAADGYGHYTGDVLLNPEDYVQNTDGPRVNVTLR